MADGNGGSAPDAYDEFVAKLMATKRGRTSSAPAVGTGPIIDGLKAQRPVGLHNRAPNLDKGEHIVFCYLAAALDTLNGIANHPQAPVDVRQRAAEVIVEASTTFLKSPSAVGRKRGKAADPPAPVHRPPIQPTAEEEAEDAIPDGWGEEAETPEVPAVPLPPPPLVPPPPPVSLNIEGDAALLAKVETCIIRRLTQHKSQVKRELKVCTLGYRSKKMLDINEVLEEMLKKGTIVRRQDPANGSKIIYHLPNADISALPPDRIVRGSGDR